MPAIEGQPQKISARYLKKRKAEKAAALNPKSKDDKKGKKATKKTKLWDEDEDPENVYGDVDADEVDSENEIDGGMQEDFDDEGENDDFGSELDDMGEDTDLPKSMPKSAKFSDSNKNWLKKAESKTMSDDDDEEEEDADSDVSEELPVEREARLLDARAKEDLKLADEELKTNIEHAERFVLPSGQEVETMDRTSEDVTLVQIRIRENLNVLANFKKLRDPLRSRAEYTEFLCNDLAHYYGYSPYMMTKLMELFPLSEIR